LKQGLAGVPGVILYDDFARSQAIVANPAVAGYANITGAACGPNAFSAPGEVIGSSIVCNATNVVAGDLSKFAFSDSVHPTPFAHRDASNHTLGLMRAAAWIK
jgi:phospholipase/lecithinase/hemolysin